MIKVLNLDILKTLNLYKNRKFNIAAELFADNNNRKFSGIDIVVLGENINKILFRENIERKSILEQYFEAISTFERYYEYEEIVGAERIKKEKISKEAFRESVANAIVHRLWDINANIKIVMSNNKIEIISPGSLHSGMSEDEYMRGYVSVLRNPIIANIFYRLGIIEKFGTGIKRIKYEYRENFVKPSFEIYENSIRITLPIIETVTSNLVNGEVKIFEKSGNGVLVTHSAGGGPGWDTAIKSDKVKGVIALEPGTFPFPASGYEVSDEEFKKLTKVPIVVYFGDNIPTEITDNWGLDNWRIRVNLARKWEKLMNEAGGDVKVVMLPDIGIKGSTHFMMADLNNKQVADAMEKWMREKGLAK